MYQKHQNRTIKTTISQQHTSFVGYRLENGTHVCSIP